MKKNAIAGKQVKNNSITGADIKESSLATVPSATSATTATSAATAATATKAKCAIQVSQTFISSVLGPDDASANPLVLAASVYDTSTKTVNISAIVPAGPGVDTGYSLSISC